jgi:hypothetical protein
MTEFVCHDPVSYWCCFTKFPSGSTSNSESLPFAFYGLTKRPSKILVLHSCNCSVTVPSQIEFSFGANFLLAKYYKVVMIEYSFREVTPAFSVASMKWMKWKGAARWSGLRLLFPTCTDAVFSGR